MLSLSLESIIQEARMALLTNERGVYMLRVLTIDGWLAEWKDLT